VTTTLSTRDLNRALMARQLLLDRREMSALGAIEHLVGMQGEEPHEPYVSLWSRLQRFQPDELVELLQGRRVVRTLLMRRTLHLVTAGDALTWRPLHQPMLETRAMGTLRRSLPGVDLAQLAAAGVRSSRSGHGRCPRSVARLASAGRMSHRATSVTR